MYRSREAHAGKEYVSKDKCCGVGDSTCRRRPGLRLLFYVRQHMIHQPINQSINTPPPTLPSSPDMYKYMYMCVP